MTADKAQHLAHQNRADAPTEPQGERIVLDRRYGAIGIPAVAAALRYAGRNVRSEVRTAQIDPRFVDAA